MKYKRIFAALIILCLLIILPSAVLAQEQPAEKSGASAEGLLEEMYGELGLSGMEEYAGDESFFKLYGFDNVFDFLKAVITGQYEFSFESFFGMIRDVFFQEVRSCISIIVEIMILCILCGLVQTMSTSFLSARVADVAFFAVYLALAALLIGVFFESVKSCTAVILKLVDFMNIAIPALLILLATNGGALTGGLVSPALMFFCNFVTYLINSFIIPISSFGFVLSIADNLLKEINISYFTKFIKKAASFLLGACFTIFVGIVSIEGLTFASIDGIGVKTLKYAASNLIPVIGGFLSSSLDTISGFLLIIKNALGLLGVLVIIATTFTPVLKLIGIFFALRIASIVVQPFTDSRIAGAVDSAANYMFFITVCVITIGIMFIVMIALLLMLGNYILMLR